MLQVDPRQPREKPSAMKVLVMTVGVIVALVLLGYFFGGK